MPIKVMAAPRDALKLLRTGIEQHLATVGVDAALARVEGLATPHRIFHLGIDALVAGKRFAAAARHVGWQATLLDRAKQPIAAAELALSRGALRFACVNRGPHATGGAEAERAAEAWSRRTKGDHELAVLRIPGAFCVALWLRAAEGGDDGFVPLSPCPAGLKANVIPDQARAEVDLRALPGMDRTDVDQYLRKTMGSAGDRIDLTPVADHPATASDGSDRLWETIVDSIEDETGSRQVIPTLMPAATDARFFRSKGVPSYGVGLFDQRIEFAQFLTMFHGHDERVSVDSVEATTRLLDRLLGRWTAE